MNGIKRKVKRFLFFQRCQFFLFLETFDPGLHHSCQPGFRPKPTDKQLGLLPFLLVVQAGFFVYFFLLCDLVVEFFRVSGGFPYFLPVDKHGMRGHAVHELAVMSNQHKLIFPRS